MKGKLSHHFQSIVQLSILAVLTIVFIGWSGMNQAQDQHRGSKAVQVNYQVQTVDAETGSAPPAQLPTVRKPLSPLEQALREARRAGDEQKVREIEARLKTRRSVNGESQGEAIHRVSTTVGYPGEPSSSQSVPPGIWGGSLDWGTDIHVRGSNTDFRESYPAMATASDGTIYIVWENVGSTQPHNYLQVYYSTDGGDNWTAYGWFSNPSFDLAQPSLAIGEGTQDLLIIAYVVQDAVPYIEVMTSPLASGTGWNPTYTVPAYYSFWEGYAKPNVWTDSYDFSGWYIYLTAEAAYSSATGNYNIVFWRSTDFGSTYDDPAQVPLGNNDPDAWRDPDGSYGGTGNDVFLACFNQSDSTLYTLISTSFGSSWSDTIAIYKMPDIPNHAVDPDIEASTNTDNIMLCCTKSFSGNDNIGQTYSQDGGQTWSYLYSLDGYTTLDEFAPELNANEGGTSWHLTYTSDHHVFYSTRMQDLSTFWQPTPDIVDDAQYASHAYTKKAITSNWGSDEAGIAWSDYRDPTTGDYDIYFDRSGGAATLYQGPASGSIAGGLFENTNNFTDLHEGGAASNELMQKIIRFRETMLAPDPANMTPAAGPVGSNEIDDQSVTDAAPTLLNDFFGIPDDQNSAGYSFIPPDPTCAAGPNHIMAATNTDFAIFDKAGNKLKEIDATQWFENVLPGLDPALVEPFGAAYDPQIVYDHFEDRWVMLYIADDNTSQSYLLLSVSDDWDPNGVWVNYAIPANRNGSTVNSNVNDYPKLGLDVYNLYVTANMFDLGGAGFQYIQIRVIEKFQIYTNMGGPLTYIDFWDLRDPDNISQVLNTPSTVVPAVTFGTPGVEYFINASPYTTGTFMTLWTLTDPASPSTLTAVNIPVTSYTDPPNADQLGGGTPLIDVGGRRVRNAVYRNGHLITAHSIADGTGTYARVHFVEIDIPSLTPVVDASFGATNYWYYYPAVTFDQSMNGIAVFNRSGSTEYAGIRYNGIVGGVVQGSAQLKAGEANYIKTFGGSRNRWGDYSGIAVDPASPDNVWMFAEYAASPANTWGTWWGEVTYVPPTHPPAQNLVALDGYDNSVPVYWDPPSGFPPLENNSSASPFASGGIDTPAKDTPQAANVQPGAADGTLSTLLSYDVYRSTTPGGPYTLVANVTRQYYRDLAASNGTTYYYVVKAVYDDGVSGYSNEDAGTPTGGYAFANGYASAPPTLDGSIGAGEWSAATVTDVTFPGSPMPVTMYTMNDGNFLYIAVDDPNNTTSEDYDQVGIYFDEDHNFEWPLASPSGEGNFWVQWFTTGSVTDYRGIFGWWPANLGYDTAISPAPGVSEGISYGSGHSQYEVAIDLTASELNAAPGADIGFYMFSYDDATGGIVFGQWPDVGIWNAPFSYGTMVLASGMGPDFAADLIVSDVGGHSASLMFGTAPDATIGYDPAYDQYAPPPPPAGAFDARFKTATDDFIRDFRHTTTTTTTWDVHYRAATGSEPPTLVWNNSQLPPDGSLFRLVDPFTGGTLVNVDMRTQNSYVDNLNLGHLQIINSVTVTFPMDILSDWNLLGLPLDVINSYYLNLFPSAIPNTCFGWNGAYFAEDSLDLGYGYWLRFPGPQVQNITGFPVNDLNINLLSGWNMISGGVNCNVALSDVNDPGGIIIPGTLFGFNGAYYVADSIKQGVGYWLRTSAAGQINLHCTTMAPSLAKKSTQVLPLDQYPSLTIMDATGANQTLYFNVTVENAAQKLSYSLPPTPPVGAFDARFSGDFRINETDNGIIRVQSKHYPIIIEAQNLPVDDQHQYVIEEVLPGQKVVKHPLIAGESVEISNSNARALKLERIATIPVKFAVEQNYPNPFNPTTEIRYAIPARDQVEIAIFNTLGQKVKTLVSGQQDAGYYSVTWDATNETGKSVGSGIYFYTVRTSKHTVIKKMMLLK